MGACFSSSYILEKIDIDLQAAPSEGDRELHETNASLLNRGPEMLQLLCRYETSSESCRKALNEPTSQNRFEALEAVTKIALNIRTFYLFALKLSEMISNIVEKIFSDVPPGSTNVDPLKDIKYYEHSALFMQLAKALSFIIRFDNLKSMNASIQNDLSMYRRMCQISKTESKGDTDEMAQVYKKKLESWVRPDDLDGDMVSSMSFFIASPYPFIAQTSRKLIDLSASDSRVDILAPYVPNLFLAVIECKRLGDKSSIYDILVEAMTCSIIICDRVEPEGIFHSHSKVLVVRCITVLKKFVNIFPDSKIETEQLLNGLRFWTLHLQDTTTSTQITKKLDL